MTSSKSTYLSRLLAALLNRSTLARASGSYDSSAAASAAQTDPQLHDRDERIAQMRTEYEQLLASKERAVAAAGQEHLERLFKRLAGPLTNLTALAGLAESGREVEIGDLIRLVRSVEKELAKAGLEPIGRVGEHAEFDVATHQRMSGGAVHAGTPVVVQLPGFRLGEKVLVKAMVSARE